MRHGRTTHNVDGRIQGQLDVPLDELGHEQARAVATVLVAWTPYAVLSSDLGRARDTAEPVAAACGVPLQLEPRLRELNLGRWQGLTSEQAREQFPDEHRAWRIGLDVPRGGGETYAQAGARAAQCVAEAELPAGRTLVVVTHGGTARALLGAMLDLATERSWRLAPLGNTCWSVLVEGERGWRLERHNAGLGPLIGPPEGAHDLGSQPADATL